MGWLSALLHPRHRGEDPRNLQSLSPQEEESEMNGKTRKECYVNRELSWLKFNQRVLEEAERETVPLCERLSFAAIYQSNLDEFFMVRIGSLKDQIPMGEKARDSKTGLLPRQQIEAVLEEPELPDTGKQHIPVQTQPGQPEVQFSDVAFAYQDKEVLHHINFSMRKNSMTALVGPSGGGKSTIANLLARLWDVKSGSVTIRGVDIRNVPLSELMDQISMVFQRVYLFQDTIYNNISMGKPDATEEEVYEAAKKARCYDFIMALPDGFQTVVGEGGATLSGGEKQRISIARCILKDAPIVILDEATASVDTDNESYIQEAISELVKGKTLLVIAHRLNTIQNADQILVIDNGQIAQHGTHEELLEQPGIYQDFVNIRKSAVGWSLV